MKLQTLYRIITSRFKKKKQETWIEYRMDICRICIHNSRNTLQKSNKEILMIFLNKSANKLFRYKTDSDAVCNICYCHLELKTAEKDESCPENKWKSINIPNKK